VFRTQNKFTTLVKSHPTKQVHTIHSTSSMPSNGYTAGAGFGCRS